MSKRRFEVREIFNPYLGKNVYRVVYTGYCLLPDEQLGAYDTLEQAKEFITKHRSAKGTVYSEDAA